MRTCNASSIHLASKPTDFMILDIVKYGNPVLRKKGERIESITPDITKHIEDMLETMRSAHGIGLASQQIGRTLQLAVVDITGVEDRPSRMEVNTKKVNPEDHMPLILFNPEWTAVGEATETGPEGCLSFPEIYGDVNRPEEIDVNAMNEKGDKIEFRCGGLLSRAIQHEYDHLQGILFIDRMDALVRANLKPEIDRVRAETKKTLG
ncbi:MAG: peptide deformylase [Verrucomicrobiales bacterium]|nr:peptide deformylase [Verrucomicrobiales bacterium]